MNSAVNGIVIWSVRTGEADSVLSILTEKGIVTAYSRGCLKPKGKLTSCSALLTYGNYVLASGKSMYTLVEGDIQKSFLHIYGDPERYALAVYFCQALKFVVTEEDGEQYLSLLLNMLFALNENRHPAWKIKAVFEFVVMTLSGFMPDVFYCHHCGNEITDGFFDKQNGSVYCSDCAKKLSLGINISNPVLRCIQYIVSSDLSRSLSFQLADNRIEELSRTSEEYFLNHIEYNLDTLNYYHTLTSGVLD